MNVRRRVVRRDAAGVWEWCIQGGMLPFREHGPANAPMTFLLLHYFGGSHREWDGVVAKLSPVYRTVAADLPGFGEAKALEGLSVQALTDRIRTLLEYLAPAPVVLVGHSMPGKAAMVVAADPPENVKGVVLVAPSPLGGEQMTDKQREAQTVANTSRAHAESFTEPGFYGTPAEWMYEQAVEDVLGGSDEAFHDWPVHGSKEVWTDRVTAFGVKTLLIVGEHDRAIDPEVQERETLPLVTASGGRMHLLPGAAHLTPYQQADEVAAILAQFARELA